MENFSIYFLIIMVVIIISIFAIFLFFIFKKINRHNKNIQKKEYQKEKESKTLSCQQNNKPTYIIQKDTETSTIEKYDEDSLEKIREKIEKAKTIEINKRKRFMGQEEICIYRHLIAKLKSNYIICPQVAIPSFLRNKQREDYYIYASLYVDFLICKRIGNEPVCVIEFQGSGHYGKSEIEKEKVKTRDELKRILFNRAKIELIEILGNNIYNYNRQDIDKEKLDKELDAIKTKIDCIAI